MGTNGLRKGKFDLIIGAYNKTGTSQLVGAFFNFQKPNKIYIDLFRHDGLKASAD